VSCLLGRPVDLQNNQAVKGVFLFSTILSSKTKRCSFLFCWRQTSQSAEGVESHFTSVSRQDLNISFCNQSFYVACLTYVCRWLTGKHLLSVRSRKIQVYFFLKHVVVKTPSLPLQLQVFKKKKKKSLSLYSAVHSCRHSWVAGDCDLWPFFEDDHNYKNIKKTHCARGVLTHHRSVTYSPVQFAERCTNLTHTYFRPCPAVTLTPRTSGVMRSSRCLSVWATTTK